MYLPENQKLLLSTFTIPNNSIISGNKCLDFFKSSITVTAYLLIF